MGAHATALLGAPGVQEIDFDAQRQPSQHRQGLKIADLINDSNESVRFPGSGATQTTTLRPIWVSPRIEEEGHGGSERPYHRHRSHTGSLTGSPNAFLPRLPLARSRSASTNDTTLFPDLAPLTASHQWPGRSRQRSVSTQSTSSSLTRSHDRSCKPQSPETTRERRESRPAYQVEEDTFIWYHRDDLGMQWNDVSKAYNAQFPDRPRIGRQGIQSRYYRVLEVEGVPKIRKRPKSLKPKKIRHHYGVIARTNRRYPWMRGTGGVWDGRSDWSRKSSDDVPFDRPSEEIPSLSSIHLDDSTRREDTSPEMSNPGLDSELIPRRSSI
ncbi:MAG: hypothetical protein M1840_000254 [Geoglossum simile]|nr:MAG: hypothetical protein M1840_000254 [Geoglossum simile]